MKHGTKIEWTHLPGYKGETWNPWVGCTPLGPGCGNCWAARQARRFCYVWIKKNRLPQYVGVVENGKWTGRLNRAPDSCFYAPRGWRDPRAIFACSMSDFFHEGADDWREYVWHTIYDTPQHLYLIPTKRPERIPDCLPSFGKSEWPWPNVRLGASVESEDYKQRITDLVMGARGAACFLSFEPLLGPIDLSPWLCKDSVATSVTGEKTTFRCAIRQVIVGGESGPGARPMHPDWARGVRDQCQAAAVPFFFKQWGEWALGQFSGLDTPGVRTSKYDVKVLAPGIYMHRLGKKRAGRLLDGRTWEEFPE